MQPHGGFDPSAGNNLSSAFAVSSSAPKFTSVPYDPHGYLAFSPTQPEPFDIVSVPPVRPVLKRAANAAPKQPVLKKAKTVVTLQHSKQFEHVRQQQLPSESLLYVLNCLVRNTLDQCPLVSRRHAMLVDRCDPLWRVKAAKLHLKSAEARPNNVLPRFRYRYRAIFSCDVIVQKQQKSISCIVDGHEKAVDYFLNALRFCRIEESISLADVVIDRTFVDGINAIASDYWFDGDKLDITSLESLKLRVSFVELIASFRFRGTKRLDLSTMRDLSHQIELGDAFLRSLADHDIWNVNFGYRRNSVSDDAIVKFAFGDFPESGNDRELTIWKASASPEPFQIATAQSSDASTFIDKLVMARRESGGSHKLRMTVICKDFAHPALFKQAQTSRRGVARIVFDAIPHFGMIVLPPRYIAGVTVRELQVWSNVPEPETDFGEEEDSDDDVEDDSDDDEEEDSDFDFGCDCDYRVGEDW
ncbi:hypothetical protein AAVH_18393 [Aphelenchoides avenae]|nr:hypothetical protein AAVH_18393 [Aphelenchus avenae]